MNQTERTAAWRTIDANFNRAVEGLRVVEDHARFVLNDGFLASKCKSLRHDLTTVISTWDESSSRVLARDTLADVGTSVTTPQEAERESLGGLVAANWQRVTQALRVMEEFAKFLGKDGARCEELRYRSYTLAKACAANERSHESWQDRRLYVLINGRRGPQDFAELVRQLIAARVDAIQLRDKALSDRELLARARQLRAIVDEIPNDERRPLFIVNDRPDIAILARADGVHIGQDELPVNEVRRLVGAAMQIGVSTHNIEQARAAVLEGADYLGCGPTFPSSTKSFAEFPGIPFLQQVATEISLPAFAIGGIDEETLPLVLKSGMSRVAVGSVITQAAEPGIVAARLQQYLSSAART